jgi:hypothetical protein
MVHNLMLPDNGVMKRLQDAVTAVEYTYPTSFQVLSAWMVGLNKPSLSAAIGSLRNVAHHHVWKLEEHLLGPHHRVPSSRNTAAAGLQRARRRPRPYLSRARLHDAA